MINFRFEKLNMPDKMSGVTTKGIRNRVLLPNQQKRKKLQGDISKDQKVDGEKTTKPKVGSLTRFFF